MYAWRVAKYANSVCSQYLSLFSIATHEVGARLFNVLFLSTASISQDFCVLELRKFRICGGE